MITQKWAKFYHPNPNKLEDCHLCHQCVSSNFISTSLLMHQHQELPWASQSSRCMTFMKFHGFLLHPLELKQLIQNCYRLTQRFPHAEKLHDSHHVSFLKLWPSIPQPFQPINGWTCHHPFLPNSPNLPWVEKKQLMYIVISDCYTLPWLRQWAKDLELIRCSDSTSGHANPFEIKQGYGDLGIVFVDHICL